MKNSLSEQLQRAGLVDKKKARKINNQKAHAERQSRKGPTGEDAEHQEIRAAAEQAHNAQVSRDRALNELRQQEAQAHARIQQARQIARDHALDIKDGEATIRFVDADVIKELNVSELFRQQFLRGQIAVVKVDLRYHLVPGPAAEKITQRDETLIIHWQRDEQTPVEPDEDDPYADYIVPDDLVW